MINRIWMFVCLLALLACVMKPPVQEMAEARSAVEMAQKMRALKGGSQLYLKRAEAALQQASEAIRQKKYDKARMQALEARRQAQKSARMSQKTYPLESAPIPSPIPE
ncbi:MAG: DUF4398 domain-containing protein [Mariprofundaceae bacterium]|nr:DUF4398 domain-containing protein [Mariprofundaceae bacterium]